jgi:hypothetical protein
MKRITIIVAVIAILASTAILLAVTNTSDMYTNHEVKNGESISLICIDYFGYYSPALGNAIKKDNPLIKNINLIYAGQKLRIRKPVEAAVKEPVKTAVKTEPNKPPKIEQNNPLPEDTGALFVKKVNAMQGVVTCVVGTARYKQAGQTGFKPLKINTVLYPGDIVETAADGRLEIIINRESVVRLKEKSQMRLEAYRDNTVDNGKTKVATSSGTIWTKMKKFKDRISRFELELPAAIAGVHGTVYQTTVNADSSSEVKVFTGEVAVSGLPQEVQGAGENGSAVSQVPGPGEIPGPQEVSLETWVQIVTTMQKLSIGKNGSPSSPEPFELNSSSDWERWNQERDKRITEMFMEQ